MAMRVGSRLRYRRKYFLYIFLYLFLSPDRAFISFYLQKAPSSAFFFEKICTCHFFVVLLHAFSPYYDLGPPEICRFLGRAELLRVLPTKTEFWYTYEEFAREKEANMFNPLTGIW